MNEGGQGNCATEAEKNDDDLSAFGTDVDKADEEALDPDDWKMPRIPGRDVDDEVSFLVDGGVGDEGSEAGSSSWISGFLGLGVVFRDALGFTMEQ